MKTCFQGGLENGRKESTNKKNNNKTAFYGPLKCGTSLSSPRLALGLPKIMEQHPGDKTPVVPGPEQEHPILEPYHLRRKVLPKALAGASCS